MNWEEKKRPLKILRLLLVLIQNGLVLSITEVKISLNLFVGNALIKLGRTEEAIKDYTKAIDLNPQ